jgi:FixJ family two-component response regulator
MSGSPLIFLVDDDRDFLEMEKVILGAGRYRTRCFSDGRDAL